MTVEYGIETPDGSIHWGAFLGRSLATEQDRSLMLLVLQKTAQELGWPEEAFVNRFRWVPRTVIVDEFRYQLDDLGLAPPLGQQSPLLEPAPIESSDDPE